MFVHRAAESKPLADLEPMNGAQPVSELKLLTLEPMNGTSQFRS